MDKVLTKHLLIGHGLPTPDFFAFNETAFREFGAAEALPAIEERLGFPLVVKPAAQGSALGIRFARSPSDVPEALVSAFSYDDRVLLERYVERPRAGGQPARGAGGGVQALPVVEARPREEYFFDFEARYEIGKTDYFCPADLPGDVDRAGAGARGRDLRAARLLRLRARRHDPVDATASRRCWRRRRFPGMTETSLLPQAAEAAGIASSELVERLVDLALDAPRRQPASRAEALGG